MHKSKISRWSCYKVSVNLLLTQDDLIQNCNVSWVFKHKISLSEGVWMRWNIIEQKKPRNILSEPYRHKRPHAQIRAMLPKLRNSINNHCIWYWLWYCINSWLTIKSKRTATTEESWFFEDSWYNEYRDLNDLIALRDGWWRGRVDENVEAINWPIL